MNGEVKALPLRFRPLLFLLAGPLPLPLLADFVNFETPQVHPIDLSPDGSRLAVCNTADHRIELFDLTSGTPVPDGAISVGMDPVSVRFQTNNLAWVVNQLSDSVSVMDLAGRVVLTTIATRDEPADVVFAGNPLKAYVSCSQADVVQVFDAASPGAPLAEIAIEGEDPRALCTDAAGTRVYAAVFESGNRSTLLGGGAETGGGPSPRIAFPPNVVNDGGGPYGGINPPPNGPGSSFDPPLNPSLPTPPPVGLIVKKDAGGAWRDDNGSDWTNLVSGLSAGLSGRPIGWDVIDNDLAIIDTATNSVSYAEGLMNACMAMAVNPTDGMIHVVGTDAINERRFEPVVNGIFVRVMAAVVDPSGAGAPAVIDLNPHLTYSTPNVSQGLRDQSLGDPRGMAWNAAGTRAYVTGMGSNNVIVIDPAGARAGAQPTIEVGEGPTGLVVDDSRGQAYVLNRFEGALSVIDLGAELETARISFFDPTPLVLRTGRKHLYDTHKTSGLGQSSCASCHIDARMDRLAWDLGDPAGSVKDVNGTSHNLGAGLPGIDDDFTDFHPMKGPMTTQTLQDIIGKEPHHWRGDRDGLEEFNPAFVGLLGDDIQLTNAEMQEFEDYLATIHFPPNPFRNLDNSLPTDLPLPGHFKTGRFDLEAEGDPLPNGNARRGFDSLYRPFLRGLDAGVLSCVNCHTVPSGIGTDTQFTVGTFLPRALGPNGEHHHALVSQDGSTQRAFKIPQLRNLYDKVGFEATQLRSRAGFGFLHDGSVDSLARFVSEPVFTVSGSQDVADLVALMLAFSGSDFPGSPTTFEPPGVTSPDTASRDAHAAVGQQVTRLDAAAAGPEVDRMNLLLGLADDGAVEVIAKSTVAGAPRGWLYLGGGTFRTDEAGVTESLANLLSRASAAAPVTFTVVPDGCGERSGIERDRDGLLDYDEIRDLVPEVPGVQNPFRPDDPDATGDNGAMGPDGIPDGQNDFDNDGETNAAELAGGGNPADNLAVNPPFNHSIGWNHDHTAIILEWDAAPLGEYVLTYTSDLITWTPPGSGLVVAGPAGGRLTWIDSGPPVTESAPSSVARRFYRIERVK